jgi:hypothetical protein
LQSPLSSTTTTGTATWAVSVGTGIIGGALILLFLILIFFLVVRGVSVWLHRLLPSRGLSFVGALTRAALRSIDLGPKEFVILLAQTESVPADEIVALGEVLSIENREILVHDGTINLRPKEVVVLAAQTEAV